LELQDLLVESNLGNLTLKVKKKFKLSFFTLIILGLVQNFFNFQTSFGALIKEQNRFLEFPLFLSPHNKLESSETEKENQCNQLNAE
jgi:hypothetical protein